MMGWNVFFLPIENIGTVGHSLTGAKEAASFYCEIKHNANSLSLWESRMMGWFFDFRESNFLAYHHWKPARTAPPLLHIGAPRSLVGHILSFTVDSTCCKSLRTDISAAKGNRIRVQANETQHYVVYTQKLSQNNEFSSTNVVVTLRL